MNTDVQRAPATVAHDSLRTSHPGHRHSTWTIALHWSSALAIVIAAACGIARNFVDDDRLRELLMDAHRQSGLYVLLALGLRLAVRWRVGMANHAGDMPPVLRWAAQLAHLALYALLFILPVLGWATSNAHGVDVRPFGLMRLPSMVEADPDLAETLSDYHVWSAWLLLALVVAHVGAAGWHHRVRRDGVLHAMLPLFRRGR
jgi:cytochrome b561